MNPIDAIREHKAKLRLVAAAKPPTATPLGATELGFDANQGKAVIATQDGGIIYANSITNGYRGPGQAVRVDRDGSQIQSDSMPRMKRPVGTPESPQVYGKLKILFRYKGALWIGGDRRTPLRLSNDLDPATFHSFNSTGTGNLYVITGRLKSSGAAATIVNGGSPIVSPNFASSELTPASEPILDSFFVPSFSKGHGLFVSNPEFSDARYWVRDRHGSAPNEQSYIYPDVTRPGLGDLWRVVMASKGIDATLVRRSSGIIQVYRSGNLQTLYDPSADPVPVGTTENYDSIPTFSWPNWVGNRVYSVILRQYQAFGGLIWQPRYLENLSMQKDRRVWVTVATEGFSFYGFVKSGDRQEFTYKIPQGAEFLSLSYHP